MGIENEEDLAGLSDEERAALEDDGDESEILKSIAGDDDDDEDDGGSAKDGNAGDPDDDAGAAADDTGGGKAAAGDPDDADPDKAAAAAEAAPVIAEEFQPEFKAVVPEGLADRLAELDQQEATIEKAFDDGEIDRDEMRRQLKAVASERTDLKIAESQAKWANEQNTDSREQRWKWEQERFFGQEKASIYKDENDPIALAALNATVKKLAADPANSRRPPGWFLDEADRRVRERFNLGGAKSADADASKKKTVREPDLSKVPKTLANLPAADIAETGADEFAYLDKLEGIALEQALRKLTPEQEARYLGAAA